MQDVFCLTFALEEERYGQRQLIPLVPGGEALPVTEENRASFVAAVVRHHLEGSVARQLAALRKGFRLLLPAHALALLAPCELAQLVSGCPRLDFDALRESARCVAASKATTAQHCAPGAALRHDVQRATCDEARRDILRQQRFVPCYQRAARLSGALC